jgi:hypothetical protein
MIFGEPSAAIYIRLAMRSVQSHKHAMGAERVDQAAEAPEDLRRECHLRESDRRSTGSHWLVVAEEAPVQRFPNGLRARVYVEPLVDLTDMRSHRVQADIQRRGTGFITVAFG